MADRIAIDTPRYKGEFELDLAEEPLTNLEWRWIKRISGYLPLTIDDGWRGGDPELFVALAVVALVRAGRVTREAALDAADVLLEAPFGSAIRFVGDPAAEPEPENQPDPTVPPADGPRRSTGGSSPSTSASPAAAPRLTGVPD